MKDEFFWSLLLIFLRLQIYEAIAAIFWQSSSYAFCPVNPNRDYGARYCFLCDLLSMFHCLVNEIHFLTVCATVS